VAVSREGRALRKPAIIAATVLLGGLVALAGPSVASEVGDVQPAADRNLICEYEVTANALNFRAGPSVRAPIERVLWHGTRFWAYRDRVIYGAYDGYPWRETTVASRRDASVTTTYAVTFYMTRTDRPCIG